MATTTTTDPRAPLVPLPVAEALARVYPVAAAKRVPLGYASHELAELNALVNRRAYPHGRGWRPAAWHRPLTGPGGWWPDDAGGGEAA